MSVRINKDELMEVLEKTPAEQNLLLKGKHGIGKSQILEKYFTEKGQKVVILFLGQMSDPGDLLGLPRFNEETGHTEFMPPYWFPTDDTPVVLFLDELNRARPEVLQPIMDLTLNRKLAGRSLPKGSRIISAVNDGDEYQVTDLDPALVSRFNVYEFCPQVTDWLLWASKNDVDERVIRFIENNREFLDSDGVDYDYTGLEKTPDRRGWKRVSDLIKNQQTLTDTDKKIVAGVIGVKATSKFFETLSKTNSISAAELLLNDFTKSVKVLGKYSTPEFAVLNDGVFRFIESEKYDFSKKSIVADNLKKYFNYLETKNMRESQAHFANMFSSPQYPKTILFVLEECDELYTKVTEFVKSIH